jgi:transcriptional regulator with XRE-family HTH domain
MPILKDLRKAIAADGRSQREIAKAAGIHHVSLSRFMTGDRDLSAKAIEKLCKALGITFKLVRK